MSHNATPLAGLRESRDSWGPAFRRQWKMVLLLGGIFSVLVGLHFHLPTLARIGFWGSLAAVIASARGRSCLAVLYRVMCATLLPWGHR